MGTSIAYAGKPRYSAEELQEFEALIHAKLAKAEETLQLDKDSLLRLSGNDTDDTYMGQSGLEDGSVAMEREDLSRSVERQQKFIGQLQAALGRIRTGEYGICRSTGKLIPKERLRLVPHATLTVEAKNQRPEQLPSPVATTQDSPLEEDLL
ncbi:MAG: TraR/DksA C4-type zinc finger protein [Flavobacteriales bacterium]|nr:TraR/DksA C4-type zinc finger protein [Flavobacteriales bacterium]